MPAEARTFARKTVWHRELAQASPIVISLQSRPAPSRYPGRLDWCRFVVEGESGVYELQVEGSDAVAAALRSMKPGVFYAVAAAGRGETAVLEVIGPSDEVTLPFPSRAAFPASTELQTPAPASAEPSLARGYAEALLVAEKLVAAFRQRFGREPTEAERAIACTLFISQDRSGGRRPLTSARAEQ